MTTSPTDLDTLVIGGGISGLTVAFRLRRSGVRVAVVEAAPRLGGAIETYAADGWRFELGPNTVLENHPAVTSLIADAGLAGEKITASPAAKRRYIYKDGRLVPLPGGPVGFLTTPIFPLSAKLRLFKEPWIPRLAGDPEANDESIADFVRRRLGQSFLDYAVGPFVSGVYAGDPERLSVRWAVPKIAALEREHGSLIRGALARRKGPAPAGGMISFPAGLATLPERLGREIGDVRTGTTVLALSRSAAGFEIATSAGSLTSRRVVLAVPADVAAGLLDEATAGRSRELAEIPYAPVAVVALGYRREDIAHPLGGFGYLVPRKEGRRTLGCLFPSEIFPGRAPEGHVALSAFLGGRTDPGIAAEPDERILSIVRDEVGQALGISRSPVFQHLRRWTRAIPQYEIGHGRFVERAREIESALPGLRIGGNYLGGVSVPDCIRHGTELAAEE